MAMIWRVKAVTPEVAQDGIPWEPFAVTTDDEGNEVILCRTLIEEEGAKSSVHEENFNLEGSRRPDGSN